MIQYLDVTKEYIKGMNALENISFEISEGEFVFLVGPSGSGKTTIIKMLIREEIPSAGKIFFHDEDITKFNRQKIYKLRRKIGVIFQDFKLIPELNAWENVAFAMEVAGKSDKEIKENVPYLLDIVGLSNRMKFFPRQLSGGEKQRVAIARAMANNPKVLIADEPTGNLDPESAWDIVQILNKINNWGTTIIMSTHGFDIVNTLHKRVIRMENGRMMRDDLKGTYEDLDDFSIKVISKAAEKSNEDENNQVATNLKAEVSKKDRNAPETTESSETKKLKTEIDQDNSSENNISVDQIKSKIEPKVISDEKNEDFSGETEEKIPETSPEPISPNSESPKQLKQHRKKIKFSTKVSQNKKENPENQALESKILSQLDEKINNISEETRTLKDLGISKKTQKALKQNGLEEIDDIVDLGKNDLEKINIIPPKDRHLLEDIIDDYSN